MRGHDLESSAAGGSYRYRAAIFDMDGVVTDTASMHATAWKELFDGLLAARAGADGVDATPFDPDRDYRVFVDGRSREDGVVTFLSARGVHLPPGGADDRPGADTVWAAAARKNELFLGLVRGGVRPFPDTVDFVRRLRNAGVRIALVSASRNAADILAAAGVVELFDVRVDGSDAAAMGLPGKPDPAMFLEAARRLAVAPADTVVVEDAVAGVDAGRRGGFGLVVGVDRAGHRSDLFVGGAHVVVDDLGQLDVGVVLTDPWLLVYDGFDPAHEGHREALCTLGNGYLATRGAAPESRDDGVHYPGTYGAGVYNRLTSEVRGHSVEDEHLVNMASWLPVDLRVAGGRWWSVGGLRAVEERQELDLRNGVLTRRVTLSDDAGRRVRVVQRRLVSMARPHIVALETTVVAEGWCAAVEVRSGVDGGVVNNNVAADGALANRHLQLVALDEIAPDTLLVETETMQSHIRVAVAARTTVADAAAARQWVVDETSAMHVLSFDLCDGVPRVIDKVAAYATSRDRAISSARLAAIAELGRAGTLASLLPAHTQAWRHLWDRFAVEIDADTVTQLELNLHVFHLLQTLSPHTAELDAGVPARGLHGEGYRGHVFWDELFVFPLLSLRAPALAQALLAYRWRRLDAARDAARRVGLAGALFPWQSGSDGREETPDQLFNTRSGRWMADHSHLQRHVSLAVAYNAWHYYQVSADVEYLAAQGAELIVEVARLFASLATHDLETDRYDIVGVMGPDEYHDASPGSSTPGLRNNAYTNVLAAWVFCRALDTVRVLDEHQGRPLREKLALEPDELERWDRLSRRLRVVFHDDGIISQFEGYDQLAELDWARYRASYGNIGRLDLILETEGDSTNRYKLCKQADVLMLFYLFPHDELHSLFNRLGYPIAPDTEARTIDYYLARTANGSTLSRVVHAWVLARRDRARSWSLFSDALRADLDDTQGGTTREGIHLGAVASTIDLVLRGYAGIAVRDDVLWFDPQLPDGIGRIGFNLRYRGHGLRVDLTPLSLRLALHPCAAAPVRVDVSGTRAVLSAGESRDFPRVPGG